ncbi:hypothetical protein KSS87_003952 [Heliosperma pusillum]|nr:hypothetical protein KSS87_003952 [Heliosperma pusillum]
MRLQRWGRSLRIELMVLEYGVGSVSTVAAEIRASFAIAFSSLVVTAIANDKSFLMNGYNTISSSGKKEDCLLASQAVFFGAAFWCIITMVFTLSCYAILMCARRRKEREIPRHNSGA